MNGERVIVPAEMQTERLKLRRWHPDDLQYYAALNADPQVMEYFPKVLSPVESDQSAARIQKHFEENQFGLWALEVPGKVSFIGFTGLMRTPFDAAFTPCVEVGWRVARPFWGRGFATEAARAALELGFSCLGLEEIVSYTTVDNTRSRRVMENLGMLRSLDEDFDHPQIVEGHPQRKHVLYRLPRSRWLGGRE